MTPAPDRVVTAVAAALAIQESDRLEAIEIVPTVEVLQERLLRRKGEAAVIASAALVLLEAVEHLRE